jgi:ankyrin repeat protein
MTAVQHNRPRSVRNLIEHGANIEEETKKGGRALNLAIFMNRHECLKILLDAQANCEHITSDSSSILHFAAENADLKIMQSLVRHSSHLRFRIDSKRQEDGLTAYELVEESTGN